MTGISGTATAPKRGEARRARMIPADQPGSCGFTRIAAWVPASSDQCCSECEFSASRNVLAATWSAQPLMVRPWWATVSAWPTPGADAEPTSTSPPKRSLIRTWEAASRTEPTNSSRSKCLRHDWVMCAKSSA